MINTQYQMNKWLVSLAVVFLSGIFSPAVTAQKRPVTIFLAGDSTMAVKLPEKRPETGWGEKLEKHFKSGKIKVENHAVNGRSTKTFISEGRWQAIADQLKKGDYVFIQFGHNDQSKEKGERYTPPADFKKNLSRFVYEARAKGAVPILMTPVMRRRFDSDGKFYDTHGEYPELAREVGNEMDVVLIDMQRLTETLIIGHGPEGSRKLFLHLKAGEDPNYPNGIEDNTHFSPYGADEVADLVVGAIRTKKLRLAKYLK